MKEEIIEKLESIILELNKAINNNERHWDFAIATETVRVYLGQLTEAIQALQHRESDKLPTIDEAGIAAVKITETLDFKLTAQEQVFFIAGFTECIKWLSLPIPPNK